jgi:pyruvate, water dikinase
MEIIMELLRDLKNIGKSDVVLAGGKGASLGEMTQVEILVPPGFVVLASAFEKFLEETDLNVEIDSILDSVNHKEMHTIENAAEKIKALIIQAEMPRDIAEAIQKFFKNLDSKYVAVRSSATAEDSASAAWAGQLESYLNTTENTLLENVKRCWASLFTPRAIFYRFEKDLHKQKISVAVVVQKMVESEKSGIAFSVHPVTQDRNQLIIEAGFGLGEAIVSGQITPDSYVVEKQPRRIIDKNIQAQSRGLYRAKSGGNEWRNIPKEKGETQVLSDDEILELSEIILKIEKHYGFPCDIEWAFENGNFYIVQSRPITTLIQKKIKTKNPFEYSELMHIDAPLAIAEITNYGESVKHIPWAKKEFLFHPYCVFERKNNVLNYLYDQRGIDWKIEQAGHFDEKIITEKVLEIYRKVESVIKTEKYLEKQEFIDFLALIKKFWVWFVVDD